MTKLKSYITGESIIKKMPLTLIKTNLKLNNQQKTLMAQHASYVRWVDRYSLTLWQKAHKDSYKPNTSKLREVFTNLQLKTLHPGVSMSSRVYQYALINLGATY